MVLVTLVLLLVVTDRKVCIACTGKLSFDEVAPFNICVRIVAGVAPAIFPISSSFFLDRERETGLLSIFTIDIIYFQITHCKQLRKLER